MGWVGEAKCRGSTHRRKGHQVGGRKINKTFEVVWVGLVWVGEAEVHSLAVNGGKNISV